MIVLMIYMTAVMRASSEKPSLSLGSVPLADPELPRLPSQTTSAMPMIIGSAPVKIQGRYLPYRLFVLATITPISGSLNASKIRAAISRTLTKAALIPSTAL